MFQFLLSFLRREDSAGSVETVVLDVRGDFVFKVHGSGFLIRCLVQSRFFIMKFENLRYSLASLSIVSAMIPSALSNLGPPKRFGFCRVS